MAEARVEEASDALEAGEDAVAAWRARRRKEPTWERIDRRATRHPRYRMVDVHLEMSPEAFAYMEAVRGEDELRLRDVPGRVRGVGVLDRTAHMTIEVGDLIDCPIPGHDDVPNSHSAAGVEQHLAEAVDV
jgi:hypothetical protein